MEHCLVSINRLNPEITEKDKRDKESKLKNKFDICNMKIKSLHSNIVQKQLIFSRFFLGKIRLKLHTESDKLRLRDEYNKFKVRTAIIYLMFPLVVLFFHYYLRFLWADTHWINMFYQLWTLYYYISLALRENFLVANGSNIKDWWLIHHYLAAMNTVVIIVWPATERYDAFVPYFTTFACYHGIVMNLQNYYHKRREYANRALGKIKSLDITYQETITEFPKELWLLLPFLLIAQVWEISLGLSLLKTFFIDCKIFHISWKEYVDELQILMSGVLQICMGIGNMICTVEIVRKKQEASLTKKSV